MRQFLCPVVDPIFTVFYFVPPRSLSNFLLSSSRSVLNPVRRMCKGVGLLSRNQAHLCLGGEESLEISDLL